MLHLITLLHKTNNAPHAPLAAELLALKTFRKEFSKFFYIFYNFSHFLSSRERGVESLGRKEQFLIPQNNIHP